MENIKNESVRNTWEANGKTVPAEAAAVPGDKCDGDAHVPSVRRGVPRGRPIVATRTYIAVIRAVPSTSCWNITKRMEKLTIIVILLI